uniref:SFR19-like C-terminal domain-containing protein n=1 Tax=Catharus ustulatus TaxID=91951 RepID=A0A8C3US72_CATUS
VMEEANLASRAKAQELIQATNQGKAAPPPLGPTPGPLPPGPPGAAPPPPYLLPLPPAAPPTPNLGGTGTGDRRDSEGRGDSDKYLKKLHTQERAVEEVKLAIKPFYQRKDITKDEYKDILRKAVHKICHSRSGEINPVKVNNLVCAYVQRYKYFRKRGRRGGGDPPNPGGPQKDPGDKTLPPTLPLPPL